MTTPAKTLLLTGFEPFGEFTDNPSEHIARELDGSTINGFRVKGIVLPVVFGEAGDRLIAAMEAVTPDVVLCLGLAAERKEIAIERLAVNLDDARMPDNAGNRPEDQAIDPDGPPACWATLPVKEMVKALQAEAIPAALSMSAGTFVCNHVFYRLMRWLSERPSIPGGFIHLPAIGKDPGALDQETLVAGTRLIIETLGPYSLT